MSFYFITLLFHIVVMFGCFVFICIYLQLEQFCVSMSVCPSFHLSVSSDSVLFVLYFVLLIFKLYLFERPA